MFIVSFSTNQPGFVNSPQSHPHGSPAPQQIQGGGIRPFGSKSPCMFDIILTLTIHYTQFNSLGTNSNDNSSFK